MSIDFSLGECSIISYFLFRFLFITHLPLGLRILSIGQVFNLDSNFIEMLSDSTFNPLFILEELYDENEILEASWFRPNDLPKIPPEPSLSNQLIKRAINSLI